MEKTRADEIREQCQAFHNAHPQVWEMFERFTFERIRIGYKNYSVSAIVERIRWEMDSGGDGTTIFKFNNNYRALYARRFMALHPEYNGFFRTRELVSKSAPATNLPELGPKIFE